MLDNDDEAYHFLINNYPYKESADLDEIDLHPKFNIFVE